MNSQYEIEINYSNKYQNEALADIIRNMDMLDTITLNQFNYFSQEVNKRKLRIENIRNRVKRLTTIMTFLESLPQGLSFKSKKYYPGKEINERAYYEYTNGNKEKVIIHDSQKINTNPSNTMKTLGRSQPLSLEEMIEINELYSPCLWKEDIKNKITLISNYDDKNINPVLNKMTSAFQLNNTHCNLVMNNSTNNSILMNQINDLNMLSNESITNNSMIKLKNKPFAAPLSLRVKETKKRFSKENNILLLSKKEINLNLPTNINLGNITDFQVEDSNQDELEDQYQSNIINDDIDNSQDDNDEDNENEYEMPINLITNDNSKKQNALSVLNNISNSKENKSNITQIEKTNKSNISQPIINNNQRKQQQQLITSHTSNQQQLINNPVASIPVPPMMPDNFKLNLPFASISQKNEDKPKTMQEEIGDNPIAKLKKIGTIKIKESKNHIFNLKQ